MFDIEKSSQKFTASVVIVFNCRMTLINILCFFLIAPILLLFCDTDLYKHIIHCKKRRVGIP